MIMLALPGALYLAKHRSPLIVPMCFSPLGIVSKTNRCFVRRPFLPRPEKRFWPIAVCFDCLQIADTTDDLVPDDTDG